MLRFVNLLCMLLSGFDTRTQYVWGKNLALSIKNCTSLVTQKVTLIRMTEDNAHPGGMDGPQCIV